MSSHAPLKVSALKVVELKAELSKRGLPTSGLKADLSARLTAALEASQLSNPEEAIAAVALSRNPTTPEVLHGDSANKQRKRKRPVDSESSLSGVEVHPPKRTLSVTESVESGPPQKHNLGDSEPLQGSLTPPALPIIVPNPQTSSTTYNRDSQPETSLLQNGVEEQPVGETQSVTTDSLSEPRHQPTTSGGGTIDGRDEDEAREQSEKSTERNDDTVKEQSQIDVPKPLESLRRIVESTPTKSDTLERSSNVTINPMELVETNNRTVDDDAEVLPKASPMISLQPKSMIPQQADDVEVMSLPPQVDVTVALPQVSTKTLSPPQSPVPLASTSHADDGEALPQDSTTISSPLQSTVPPPSTSQADERTNRSDHPATRSLYVSNLVRPFTLQQFKEYISEFGALLDGERGLWLGPVKSHAYVTFVELQSAVQARKALTGQVWPVGTGKEVEVVHVQSDVVSPLIEQERKAGRVRLQLEVTPTLQHDQGGDEIQSCGWTYTLVPWKAKASSQRGLASSIPLSVSEPSLRDLPNDALRSRLDTRVTGEQVDNGWTRTSDVSRPRGEPEQYGFTKTKSVPKLYWKAVDSSIAQDRLISSSNQNATKAT